MVNETKLTKDGGKKPKSAAQTFVRTFWIAFLVFVVLCTPGFAFFGKVADQKLFSQGDVILEEELPALVDKDSPFFQAFQDKNRVNVLLLGVNDNLTDTIMVASFDLDAKHVDLISIPRDTYYHRDGYDSEGENKINAAYRGNPLNTAMAVSDVLLGMPINYYAIIDYKGIEKIVDSMGGVPMDIPNINHKGGMYYKDPYDKPPLVIALPEGPRVLNGKEAVQFLRFRHGYLEGDIGRVKAQQEFMKSAFKQCISFNLPKIASTVFKNVESDITWKEVASIAASAKGIANGDMETYLLPNTPQTAAPWYVLPDAEKTADMIREIYSIEPEASTNGSADDSGQ